MIASIELATPSRSTLATCQYESGVAVKLTAEDPKKDGERHYVKLVLTSKDEGELEKAFAWLTEQLPGQPAA